MEASAELVRIAAAAAAAAATPTQPAAAPEADAGKEVEEQRQQGGLEGMQAEGTQQEPEQATGEQPASQQEHLGAQQEPSASQQGLPAPQQPAPQGPLAQPGQEPAAQPAMRQPPQAPPSACTAAQGQCQAGSATSNAAQGPGEAGSAELEREHMEPWLQPHAVLEPLSAPGQAHNSSANPHMLRLEALLPQAPASAVTGSQGEGAAEAAQPPLADLLGRLSVQWVSRLLPFMKKQCLGPVRPYDACVCMQARQARLPNEALLDEAWLQQATALGTGALSNQPLLLDLNDARMTFRIRRGQGLGELAHAPACILPAPPKAWRLHRLHARVLHCWQAIMAAWLT